MLTEDEYAEGCEFENLRLVVPPKRDFKMLVTPGFYEEWYGRNKFEEFTSDLLLTYSNDNICFIDIGAHYGYYTLLIGTKYPGCRILAFEPIPENFEILKRNVALNNLGNVELYNFAASDKNELREIRITELSSRSSFYDQPWENPKKIIKVRTMRLDNVLDNLLNIPVIVKIDTEGHEVHVLEGLKRSIAQCDDLKIVIEFNPKCLISAQNKPLDLLNKLSYLDFDIYSITDDKRVLHKIRRDRLDNWDRYLPDEDAKSAVNLFCIKNKKSLSVLFFCPQHGFAGADLSLFELIKTLIHDYGIVCTVVLPDHGPLKDRFEKITASTMIIGYHWWCGAEPLSENEVKVRIKSSISNLAHNLNEISEINPDVVVTNTIDLPWGAITAHYLGKPHAWFVREFGELDHNWTFYPPLQTVLKIIQESSNVILTNSDAVKNTLFGSVQDKEIHTIYPFIEIPLSMPNADADDFFALNNATKLIIFGTLLETKGHKDAILAIKELIRRGRVVELIVLGSGNPVYERELIEIVKINGLENNVKFISYKENPYPIVKQADIVLVCSRNEAFGRITLEAMLLKKPVIGTNSGGTLEMIKEGFNGLLYEPGNYRQLADKIEFLIVNQEKIQEFGENGNRFALANFTREKSGRKLLALLRHMKNSANISDTAFSRFTSQTTLMALSSMVSSLFKQDEQINALEANLKEKDSRTADFGVNLQEKDSRINGLEASVQEKVAFMQSMELQVAELHKAIVARDSYIQHIQGGMVMRLMTQYKLFIDRTLRPRSGPRKVYDLVVNGIRLIVNKGFSAFFRESCNWVKNNVRANRTRSE